MTSTFLGNLSLDFLKLLENNDEYNVIIEIGEGSFKKLFRAHSIILCYRCPYLYNKLKDIDYNDRNIKVIKKPKVLVKVFDIVIRNSTLERYYEQIYGTKSSNFFYNLAGSKTFKYSITF
ncbi:9728_t:CDS:2 [Acaulospora morrowiae]|uniref:9728_t:CDS:1 n=1 Tax=Acaulospora morrowiae TaxID=94023 RepID=A0A9N8V2B6_9GLOM|nr:9728_t:CDS:2 [Acaulospora morrowiae]